MNLTKRRAKRPLIENGNGIGAISYRTGVRSYTIDCRSPWVQGGHETEYTLHLTKAEMLQVMDVWVAEMIRDEREALANARPMEPK